eukprot:GHVH01012295.1.p1 GENE.GHVH01012295.1~~GHVH01012295.1.p1  ORF type:complete len:622 (+),score=68.64 GHVH01012295.1:121-1986(+)
MLTTPSGAVAMDPFSRNVAGQALMDKLTATDVPPPIIHQPAVTHQLVSSIKQIMSSVNLEKYTSSYLIKSLQDKGEPVVRSSSKKAGNQQAATFTASHSTRSGQMIVAEKPLLVCAASIAGAIDSFINLSPDVISILTCSESPDIRTNLLSEADVSDVRKGLKFVLKDANVRFSTVELENAICWWHCLLKSFAWVHPELPDHWSLYRVSLHLPVSCVPNCIVRYLPNGTAALISAIPLHSGDVLCIAPNEVTLYASIPHRRLECIQSCHQICSCERCSAGVDAARRVWCRCCRKRIESTANMTAGAPFAIATNDQWLCSACGRCYSDDLMPKAIETVLEGVFLRLQDSFKEMPSEEWLSHISYLQNTCAETLSPHHWLMLGVRQLLAEFYIWKSATLRSKRQMKRARDLAYWHGMKFIGTLRVRVDEESQIVTHELGQGCKTGGMFVEVAAPLILSLLINALKSNEIATFLQLVEEYVPTVLLQYGAEYPVIEHLIIPSIRVATEYSHKKQFSKLKQLVSNYEVMERDRIQRPSSLVEDDGLHLRRIRSNLKEYKGMDSLWAKKPWSQMADSSIPVLKKTKNRSLGCGIESSNEPFNGVSLNEQRTKEGGKVKSRRYGCGA